MAERVDGGSIPESIGGRYEVLRLLGRGGMASVFEVRDASGARSALKRLDPGQRRTHERARRLFEQEFHTLAQLAHPRIVRVHDYVAEGEAPYYTMELLDGGDLRQASPAPWKRVCELLCDVCSALSLLHSRRLVHRDLTPGNIHCSSDGKAKLIDLGAIVQAGPCKQVVGTAAYIAPEALTAQHVDARTDLFSLGATAYFALTRRHAYPARRIDGLRDAWRTPPPPLTRLVDGIPPALNELIMSLLQLQAIARPATAAEVMDRLSAIAGIEVGEELRVQSAYLSTPELVGREAEIISARESLLSTTRGTGAALVITGAAGVGRSRFLDACVLEAKLLGARVLRADARDGATGEGGASRALLEQLLQIDPESTAGALFEHAPVLALAFPELIDEIVDADMRAPTPTFEGPQQQRAAIADAVGAVILGAASKRPLVLAVDDLARLDLLSAGLLSWLASRANKRSLGVLVTVSTGVDGAGTDAAAVDSTAGGAHEAARWFEQNGSALRLRNLRRQDVDGLLLSMFGDVPNVRYLGERLFSVTSGNPRALMQLAQHLLDAGVLRYHAGSWALPVKIADQELPSSLEAALRARIAVLDDDARGLAQAMALSTLRSVDMLECGVLMDAPPERVAAALDALMTHNVVLRDGVHYTLASPSWSALLQEGLDDECRRLHHRRLAEVASGRGTEPYRCVQHLTAAGELGAALNILLPNLADATVRTADSPAVYYDAATALPPGWDDTFRTLIEAAPAEGRSALDCFEVKLALVSYSIISARGERCELLEVAEQLRHDAGLDLYQALDPELPAGDRLGQAFGAAQARYDSTPEHERVNPPAAAIQLLARLTLLGVAMAGRNLDAELLEALPSLEPYAVLSPALPIIEENRQATLHVLAARVAAGRAGYRSLLARVGDEAPAGLDAGSHAAMCDAMRWAVGLLEANAGLPADEWADAIEKSPLFEVNALRLRVLQAYRQGNAPRADELKRTLDLMSMRNLPPQLFEGNHVWTEALAHALSDDLVRAKQVIAGVRAKAESQAGWRPCLGYAQAQYQRLRGDHALALAELEAVLPLVEPGKHVAWAPIATAHVLALLDLGRAQEARELASQVHERAQQADLDGIYHYTLNALALSCAATGEIDAAVEYADAALAEHQRIGAQGAQLGAAHETRARVALAANDRDTFEAHAALCAASYKAGHNPALTAKYQRLMRSALQAGVGVSSEVQDAALATSDYASEIAQTIATELGRCRGPDERAERVLRLILDGCGGAGGYLYVMREGGPELVAQSGRVTPPADMDTRVGDYLASEFGDVATETSTCVADSTGEATASGWHGHFGEHFLPLVLRHLQDNEFVVTGMAVLDVPDLGRFTPQQALLQALSRSLLRTGDATVVNTAA